MNNFVQISEQSMDIIKIVKSEDVDENFKRGQIQRILDKLENKAYHKGFKDGQKHDSKSRK